MGLFNKKKKKKLSKADEQTLLALKNAGSNLSKPHNIEYFFYFTAEKNASQAAKKLQELGFLTQISPPNEEINLWSIISNKSIVPTPEAVAENTVILNEIARTYGGEYDGWGSEVVK